MCDRYSRFAACGGYQIRRQTFLVVQQDLQKVFGLEMLMIAHERPRLCSLHKSSCPLRVRTPISCPRMPDMTLKQG